MNKKLLMLPALALVGSMLMFKAKVNASGGGEYLSYSEMNFKEPYLKLLHEYTDEEMDEYFKKLPSKKFSGWNTYTICNHKKVEYTVGTVFMYKNEGKTGTSYKFEYKEEEISKRSFSVTGNLSISLSGNVKKLKAGLDDKLKIEYSSNDTKTTRTTWSTSTTVDPNTMLKVKIKGEGYIDSGVAEKYLFWIRTHKGGYEIFNIATEYYSMEKVAM